MPCIPAIATIFTARPQRHVICYGDYVTPSDKVGSGTPSKRIAHASIISEGGRASSGKVRCKLS
ncbi:hypothetical protein LOAG_04488 [Loa loa]|uniref:Pectate lyase n=1 Tax=Loa loa TaxID=7209 RepID=A0A1I7W5S6_LOALO|nr:hypothetical protein LOAG_04488 [Loa loa]EFO23995.2 hypothetical protein LOAG_04488 [Loa loa]